MAEVDVIAAYLEALDAHLRGVWPQRQRVLDEVRAHLEDAAGEVGPAAAVARFGAVQVVAHRFAVERLTAWVEVSWRPIVVGVLALMACSEVDRFFPVAPVFRLEASVPFASTALIGCRVLQALTWPLLALGLALRTRHRPFAASNALIAALVCATLGFEGAALAQVMISTASFGAAATTPLLLRVALIVAMFLFSAPMLAAHDAFSATHR